MEQSVDSMEYEFTSVFDHTGTRYLANSAMADLIFAVKNGLTLGEYIMI
jgi:hypothetical protein